MWPYLIPIALFFLWAWAPVVYTDRWWRSATTHGCARGPVVFIRPAYRGDSGLLAHERVHVKQWWRTLGLHSFAYPWSRGYRLEAEVEAYQEQAKHYSDDRRMLFAQFVAERYDLRVSVLQAYALLTQPD